MADINYEALVEVFKGNLWEAEAMIKDETLSAVTSPYSGMGGAVLVMVNKEEEVYARKIVAERKE